MSHFPQLFFFFNTGPLTSYFNTTVLNVEITSYLLNLTAEICVVINFYDVEKNKKNKKNKIER